MSRDSYNYRKIYEHCYGSIPMECDIHHIDGDYSNNHPANLQAVTRQEHYDIHYKQEDYGACFKIANSMKISRAELSEVVRRENKQKVEAGTHNFLGGEIQRKTAFRRIAKGTHNFIGTQRVEGWPRQYALGKHPSQLVHTCPQCGYKGKGGAMKRWHFDRCRNGQ